MDVMYVGDAKEILHGQKGGGSSRDLLDLRFESPAVFVNVYHAGPLPIRGGVNRAQTAPTW
jgi:hypothetical protein